MDVFSRVLKSPPRKTVPGERCDFCATPIGEPHSHLVDTKERRLMCSCRPCYLVFVPAGAAHGRYKTVPERHEFMEGFAIADSLWEALQIPIGLAFFFFNSEEGKAVAFYPGPAGATESLLPLDAWNELTASDARLDAMLPDVEALLVRRERDRPAECFIVPIDACYRLVGVLRSSWKGFDGGQEAHAAIDAFFNDLHARAQGEYVPIQA